MKKSRKRAPMPIEVGRHYERKRGKILVRVDKVTKTQVSYVLYVTKLVRVPWYTTPAAFRRNFRTASGDQGAVERAYDKKA